MKKSNKTRMSDLVDKIYPVIKTAKTDVNISFYYGKENDEFVCVGIKNSEEKWENFNFYPFWNAEENMAQVKAIKKSITEIK